MENKDDHGRKNIKQNTPCQNIIPTIPDDIAMEILSRLPHESLFKFTSVCKTWQSLFLNPSFIKLHEDNQNETLLIRSVDAKILNHRTFLLHVENPKIALSMTHPFHKQDDGIDVVGSINGLICLSCTTWAQDIAIWNPVTKHYKYLPRPIFRYTPYTMYVISLGFCFHSPTRDYVVVRIARFDRGEKTISLTELYSLNSNSWKTVENEVDFPILFSTCDTIVKGEPYWWAGSRIHGGCFRYIVGFDFSNKIFRRVPKIRVPFKEFQCSKLVNYKSLLAVLVDSTLILSSLHGEFFDLRESKKLEQSEQFINMFVLGNDGPWRLGLRVGVPQGIGRAIGCSNNGRIIFEDKSGMIVLYDTKKERVENINIVGAEARRFTVSNYNASVVSIKGSKRRDEDSYIGGEKRQRHLTDLGTEAR